MSYERMIGWRYLYRRPQQHGMLLLGMMLLFLGVMVLSTVFFVMSGRPPPIFVVAFIFAAVGLTVVGLIRFFSIFTTVSVFGVVLGVSALTCVLSVASGFQAAFKDKVLGVNAHVLIMRADFQNYRTVEKLVAAEPHVLAEQPFVFVEMLITRGKGELSGIAMKGVDPSRIGTVLDLPKHMVEGSVGVLAQRDPSGLPPIVIGRELAAKLKAKLDDEVSLVLPNVGNGDWRNWSASSVTARTRKFRVRGIFYSGFQEYDSRLVYIEIKEAQDFLGQGDIVTGVEMKVDDVDKAQSVARSLEHKLGGEPYTVVDWRELNNNLFTALTIQKVALLIFLTLIIIVAAFNMVAALTMMVLDKVKEIAILKSMGGSALGVARLFQVVGMTIGGIGTAVGLALGVVICEVIARYGYQLDAKVYLIDQLPIAINPFEVALVGGITLLICFVATLYPALKASSLRPVEGLRYE